MPLKWRQQVSPTTLATIANAAGILYTYPIGRNGRVTDWGATVETAVGGVGGAGAVQAAISLGYKAGSAAEAEKFAITVAQASDTTGKAQGSVYGRDGAGLSTELDSYATGSKSFLVTKGDHLYFRIKTQAVAGATGNTTGVLAPFVWIDWD